jgi:hypothetical protein
MRMAFIFSYFPFKSTNPKETPRLESALFYAFFAPKQSFA